MAKPPEYDNLLRAGSFKEAAPSKESIAQLLRNADDMLASAKSSRPDSAKVPLSYDGMFNVITAVLELHGVRPDRNRNIDRKRGR